MYSQTIFIPEKKDTMCEIRRNQTFPGIPIHCTLSPPPSPSPRKQFLPLEGPFDPFLRNSEHTVLPLIGRPQKKLLQPQFLTFHLTGPYTLPSTLSLLVTLWRMTTFEINRLVPSIYYRPGPIQRKRNNNNTKERKKKIPSYRREMERTVS